MFYFELRVNLFLACRYKVDVEVRIVFGMHGVS
jgi:hypothetical protein